MNVHQLSVHYVAEQDRLLVRINTNDGEELRLWLTRRLMVSFWPMLNKTVADHVMLGEVTSQIVVSDDSAKQMMGEFQRAQTLEKADFKTPYNTMPEKLPLGPEPLLVSDIKITPLEKRQMQIHFLERLQDAERLCIKDAAPQEPRGFELSLDAKLIHGLVHLLAQALTASQWQAGNEFLSAVATSESGKAVSDKPKYLN